MTVRIFGIGQKKYIELLKEHYSAETYKIIN